MTRRRLTTVLAFFAAVAGTGSQADAAVVRVGTPVMPIYLGNPYAPVALPQAVPAQMIFDSLTLVGPDGTALPSLAVRWQRESDRVWVFHLASGVKFSNSEDFTADAVVAALEYLRTPDGRRESSANMDATQSIAGARARDPLTVEVTTIDPDPILPLHLSFLRIPAPGAWAKAGRDEFVHAPVGTGPFTVETWTPALVTLKRNPHAFRPPRVDGATIRVIGDPTARVQAFASDAIDVALVLSAQDRGPIEDSGGQLIARAAPMVTFMLFVTNKDTPLKDVRVQRALNYAVNKEAMIASFLDGATKPASQFSHEGAFGFDPTLKPYPYDPERARALLKEAGVADGFAFTVLLDTATAGYAETYQQIAQDLAHVGVHMSVRATPVTRIAEFVQTAQWPAEAFGWTFAGFDSMRGYLFRSCGWHHPYHCDPEMTPLLAAANAAPTEEGRLKATQAALAFERERPPGVLLWRGVSFDGIGARVSGFTTEEDVIRWDKVEMK